MLLAMHKIPFRLEVPKSPKPSTRAAIRSIRETPDIAPTPFTRCLLVCALRQALAQKKFADGARNALGKFYRAGFSVSRAAPMTHSAARLGGAFLPLELGHRSALEFKPM
jgi:hypothetical protein